MSWNIKVQPEIEPHTTHEDNITYNLGKMLRRAGFDPNLHDGVTVKVLRPITQGAWQSLYENPEHYKQFEPESGFGTRTDALMFMARLSDYMRNAPDDYVMRVS